MILRQSTSQDIRFGPFVDSGDGFTAETALTIAQADMQLSKDGAAYAQKNASGNATHDTDGWYSTTLNATDTNTVGELILQVNVSGALPVWVRWYVVEEAVYDALYASSAGGYLQPTVAGRTLDVTAGGTAGIDWANIESPTTVVDLSGTDINQVDTVSNIVTANVTQVSGDATAADNLEADYDGTGYNKSASTIGTCTTNTDMRGTDSALLAASAPTNFGDLAITVTTGQVTVGTNNDKTGYSISGTKNTLDDLNDIAATAIVSGGAINTTGGAVDTVTANTDMRGTDNAALATTIGTPAGADVSADIASIKNDTSVVLPDVIDDLAIKRNTAFPNFEFLMVLASDGRTPATGLTVTGQRSIDGSAFNSIQGTIAEVSNGIYQLDALASDTNGDVITWRFSAATADDTFITFKTVQ